MKITNYILFYANEMISNHSHICTCLGMKTDWLIIWKYYNQGFPALYDWVQKTDSFSLLKAEHSPPPFFFLQKHKKQPWISKNSTRSFFRVQKHQFFLMKVTKSNIIFTNLTKKPTSFFPNRLGYGLIPNGL